MAKAKKKRQRTSEQIRKLVMSRLKQYASAATGLKLKELLKGKKRTLKVGEAEVEVKSVEMDQRKLQKLIKQAGHWQVAEAVVQVCFAQEIHQAKAEREELAKALKEQEQKPEVVEYLRLAKLADELDGRPCHQEHACLRHMFHAITCWSSGIEDDYLIAGLAGLLAHQEHLKKDAEA